jgi:hypothetical protein
LVKVIQVAMLLMQLWDLEAVAELAELELVCSAQHQLADLVVQE